MPAVKTLAETYLAVGIGGSAFIALVWLLTYVIVKIRPELSRLNSENAATKEVVRNNTTVIREVSRSNDNVAAALMLINKTVEQLSKVIEKVEERSERVLLKITEVEAGIRRGNRGEENEELHATSPKATGKRHQYRSESSKASDSDRTTRSASD